MHKRVRSNLRCFIALMAMGLMTATHADDEPDIGESAAPLLWQPSMNVFRRFSVDAQTMYTFYRDVLGLKQLATIGVGNGGGVARFLAGTSEIKLTAKADRKQYVSGGVKAATGLRLLTFFYPDEAPLVERFRAQGYAAPEFARDAASGHAKAFVQDPDGQWVELVVATGAATELFAHIEVGLTVSDIETSRRFYRDFVGLEELAQVNDPVFGTIKYAYRHGTTTINLRSFGSGLPADTGSGGIQYVVSDVNRVDALAKVHKITIDQPLSGLTGFSVRTLWLDDPDGITNYFAETDASRNARQ